jgi:16S rRNA (guanine527-N7)-methyltransferase
MRQPSESVAVEAAEREGALAITPVSRETADRLGLLVDELRRWQGVKNLVGPATLRQVWMRHVADSLQLLDLAPGARRWIDLGSGAGFPGLVLGIAALDGPGMSVDLVESNGRKCAFLRHVARLTGAPVTVHEGRIEATVARFTGVDVVTARAVAPLPELLALAHPLLTNRAVGLFPKGRGAEDELTEAAKSWTFDAELLPSRTDSLARIVRIRSLRQRG